MKTHDKNPTGQRKLSDMIGFWNSKNDDKNTIKTECSKDKDKTAEQTPQEDKIQDKKPTQEFVRRSLTVGKVVDETRRNDFRQKLAAIKSLTRNPQDSMTGTVTDKKTPKKATQLDRKTSHDRKTTPDKNTPDLTRRKRKLNSDDRLDDRSIKTPRILARMRQEGRAKQELITKLFISSNSRGHAEVPGPHDDCLPDGGGGGERSHGQVPHQGQLGAAALIISSAAQHSREGTGAKFRGEVKLAVTGQHSGGGRSAANHAAATTSFGAMPSVGKSAGNFGTDRRS